MPFILGLVGLVLLGIAVFLFLKTKRLLSVGKTAKGKIVDVVKKESQDQDEEGFSSTSTTYYPVIEFKTVTGQVIKFEAGVGRSNQNAYEIGHTVDVIYDPNKPQDAKINSFLQLWFVPLILGVIGLIVIVVAGLVALAG